MTLETFAIYKEQVKMLESEKLLVTLTNSGLGLNLGAFQTELLEINSQVNLTQLVGCDAGNSVTWTSPSSFQNSLADETSPHVLTQDYVDPPRG